MLIKGMVPAVKPHQTVWVVDPPARAAVIVRIPAQIQRLALCLEYLFSPGDCVSHHFHSFDSDSGRLRHQRIGGGFAGAQQEDGNKGGAEHQQAHDQVGLGEAIFS